MSRLFKPFNQFVNDKMLFPKFGDHAADLIRSVGFQRWKHMVFLGVMVELQHLAFLSANIPEQAIVLAHVHGSKCLDQSGRIRGSFGHVA